MPKLRKWDGKRYREVEMIDWALPASNDVQQSTSDEAQQAKTHTLPVYSPRTPRTISPHTPDTPFPHTPQIQTPDVNTPSFGPYTPAPAPDLTATPYAAHTPREALKFTSPGAEHMTDAHESGKNMSDLSDAKSQIKARLESSTPSERSGVIQIKNSFTPVVHRPQRRDDTLESSTFRPPDPATEVPSAASQANLQEMILRAEEALSALGESKRQSDPSETSACLSPRVLSSPRTKPSPRSDQRPSPAHSPHLGVSMVPQPTAPESPRIPHSPPRPVSATASALAESLAQVASAIASAASSPVSPAKMVLPVSPRPITISSSQTPSASHAPRVLMGATPTPTAAHPTTSGDSSKTGRTPSVGLCLSVTLYDHTHKHFLAISCACPSSTCVLSPSSRAAPLLSLFKFVAPITPEHPSPWVHAQGMSGFPSANPTT
jgi:hypothetical protein